MAYGHYKADDGSEYGSFEVYFQDGFEDPCEYGEDCEECPPTERGWYWWACFPGCYPDGPAFGPYDTEEEAFAAAEEGV